MTATNAWNCRWPLTAGNSLLASRCVNSHTEHPDLAEDVRRLLHLHRGDYLAIAVAANVSYSWLTKFARGKITNPGYAKLRRLYLHLHDKPVPLPRKHARVQGEGQTAGELMPSARSVASID